MRLVELSANDPRFKTVTFNKNGLSIILGQKKPSKTEAASKTKTYNGVGKSLLIELLHFCLGSNANDAFKKHLIGWVFSLTIELGTESHVIHRSADKPGEITFDGERTSLTELRTRLRVECFQHIPDLDGLTFRSLFPLFVRSGRGAYERFDRATEGDSKNEYSALLRNSFFLGLDLHLADAKHELRSRETLLSKTMKQLNSDPLFADLLADDKAGIELSQLRDDEVQLEKHLREFSLAEDHAIIQRDANATKKELEFARRELVKTEEAIAQVERSLETKGDLDPAVVSGMYEEAKIAIPDAVRRTIAEVLTFQRELTAQRLSRLTADRQRLVRDREELRDRTTQLAKQLEERLRYLGTHLALDEYLAVSERLNDLRQRIAKLQASAEQREKVSRELKTIKAALAVETVKTDDYLSHIAPLIEEANVVFRRLTQPLYGNRASGLAVSNDGGENTLRYKIEAHIPRDAAEGINEVKIFCYDFTVLTLRRGHSMDFLVHDSSLFSPVDHRQRLSMLLMADALAEERGLQYVVALNEHDVTSMEPADEAERSRFERIFTEPKVVLRLTDEAPKDRLLGINVDMNYRIKSETRDAEND